MNTPMQPTIARRPTMLMIWRRRWARRCAALAAARRASRPAR
jgi:hypothetical protein